MKATELLTEQHEEVRALFKQLTEGEGDSEATLAMLADSLAAHMTIEQELFYPAMLDVKEDLVLEAYEEHAVARFALRRLLETAVGDQTFQAKVVTLQELIEHHTEEEEEALFPKADEALGEASEALGAEMEALFDATMAEGYASAVGRGGSAISSGTAPDLHA